MEVGQIDSFHPHPALPLTRGRETSWSGERVRGQNRTPIPAVAPQLAVNCTPLTYW